MDGFKPVVKMKTGGSVAKAVEKSRMGKAVGGMHDDIKEDKKIVKKAINLHDDQLHEGKKTDLTTLKKGGRTKKDAGTVRKFKCGGKIKKMADGGLTDVLAAGQATGANPTVPQAAGMAEMLKRKKLAQLMAQKAGAAGAAPGGGMAPPAAAPAAPVAQPQAPNIGMGAGPGIQPGGTTMKCGGKVKGKK